MYVCMYVCIQESWLSEGAGTQLIQLEGYKCIPHGKSCSTKGGLIIYLQDTFDYTWEGKIIHIKKGKNLKTSIHIGNIYRQPKDLLETYNEFNNEFVQI